ncbi:hypothetical protein OG21DRAFT_1176077 [Imleria badia]|nr:hypothetical protein OG21DRAFT_1176077 [Imleria badia]
MCAPSPCVGFLQRLVPLAARYSDHFQTSKGEDSGDPPVLTVSSRSTAGSRAHSGHRVTDSVPVVRSIAGSMRTQSRSRRSLSRQGKEQQGTTETIRGGSRSSHSIRFSKHVHQLGRHHLVSFSLAMCAKLARTTTATSSPLSSEKSPFIIPPVARVATPPRANNESICSTTARAAEMNRGSRR